MSLSLKPVGLFVIPQNKQIVKVVTGDPVKTSWVVCDPGKQTDWVLVCEPVGKQTGCILK